MAEALYNECRRACGICVNGNENNDAPIKEYEHKRWNAYMRSEGYVLTASPHRMLDVCLTRLGLYELFDNVWSCDDFGTTKSDVEIYRMVALKLSVDVKDCIFFDDNINALTVASNSGMRVIGVYDDSSLDMEEEIRSISNGYIYKFSELIGLLEKVL